MKTEKKFIKCKECAYNIGIDKIVCTASLEPIEITATNYDGCRHGLKEQYEY